MKRLTATFVIGANATGKTFFINEHFSNQGTELFNVYNYQQQAYKEAGFSRSIPFREGLKCLYLANKMLLADIIDTLRQGRNVVVEQTLFKAKRRIAYVNEIRREVDADIEFFVMCPSDECWELYITERKLQSSFGSLRSVAEQIEFPNPAEGIDRIYEVIDGDIRLRMDPPKPELLAAAHKELAEEAQRMQSEAEDQNKRKELLASMNTRPFWHYCEVCGKKAFLTATEAFHNSWDFPPHIGHFGLLGPRTCGKCNLKDTLYWKIHQQEIPLVFEKYLTEDELKTWRRIKAEPDSLLVDEE